MFATSPLAYNFRKMFTLDSFYGCTQYMDMEHMTTVDTFIEGLLAKKATAAPP